MKRVFVYEHLSSGAFDGQPGAESLAREGKAMLEAVVADLAGCEGIEVRLLPDPEAERVASLPAEEHLFRQHAAQSDLALLIAPEFDDILAQRCLWAVEEGCRLLGPTVEAVRLTADKLRLAEHLTGLTIPTTSDLDHPPWPLPWVCKPRFGAGSQSTFLIRDKGEWEAMLRLRQDEGFHGELILQPYLSPRDGPLSMAFLVGARQCFALPLMRQHLSNDGRFCYHGGESAWDLDAEPYRRVAQSAIASVEGLLGYVGVDMLWPVGADAPVVVEINPRLTTSYVGLRQMTPSNLMQTWLDLMDAEREVGVPKFIDRRVRFGCDGTITG